MDEVIMRCSIKSRLSPLILPDSNSEKGLYLENAIENHNSHPDNAFLKSDYPLSPINPAAWKGASSRARFGLDIGGTLCKVVFFEPLDDLDSRAPGIESSSPCFSSDKNGLGVEMIDQENSLSMSNSLTECCCSLKLHSFSPRMKESNEEAFCTASPIEYRKRFLMKQACTNSVDESESVLNINFIKEPASRNDGYFHGTTELSIDPAKCSNNVRKLWASSHDPVILSGRGTLYFKCFETWRIDEFLFLTKEHALVTTRRALGATGGGARKFSSKFLEIAGLELNRFDELKSLVRGIGFLMKYAQHESFEYPQGSFQGGLIQRPFKSLEDSSNDSDETLSEEENPDSANQFRDLDAISENQTGLKECDKTKIGGAFFCHDLNRNGPSHDAQTLYPYLIVNIGSGVSILLVESPEQFKRVGGTSLGGSTFLGLTSALTGCTSFKEAVDLAATGDSTEIDMLVGDIYGGDYSEMGLAATTVASSFGKLVQPSRRETAMQSPQHLAKATLLMITNNIGSLAKLHAQATGVEHVLFTGSFMHGNKYFVHFIETWICRDITEILFSSSCASASNKAFGCCHGILVQRTDKGHILAA
ncbi:hypothetical protein KP509_38G022000 [Ceratopteris richardii]|uniref:pantothenate kinase n=1 Tax=Ceratopteris richardii TaxID=49495 RepID=A0A8T2Q307_CERRI|nr:hypothetical protein KP509_38G022000 [Ceratopteris richardii]